MKPEEIKEKLLQSFQSPTILLAVYKAKGFVVLAYKFDMYRLFLFDEEFKMKKQIHINYYEKRDENILKEKLQFLLCVIGDFEEII